MHESHSYSDTEGLTIGLLPRTILWLSHHWMGVINGIVALFVMGAILPPVLMKAGYPGAASILYTIYGATCHQLPQRSYFLFGQKLMYPLNELIDTWPQARTLWEQRAIIGDSSFGYKVALANRCSAIYPAILLAGLIFALRKSNLKPLSLQGFVILILPMMLDGGSHLISEITRLGFRDTNVWLQWLTRNSFAPEFYAGDALGTLNWLLRTLTGGLFGIAIVWFAYPYIKQSSQENSSEADAGRKGIG